MMNLDEAIKHCEEVAEAYDTELNLINCGISNESCDNCLECASEQRQLADWLRELKKYRIAHYKLRDMDYEYDFNSKFGDNPMYYGEKVWDLFGDIDASVEYEVMGYEEVNTDEMSI